MAVKWRIFVPRADDPRRWTPADEAWYSVEDTAYALVNAVHKYGRARAVRLDGSPFPKLGRVATPETTIRMFMQGVLVPADPEVDGPLTPAGIAAKKRAQLDERTDK